MPIRQSAPFSICIAATTSRSRLPASSASTNSTSSSAGSARQPSSIVRLAAIPPVAVPASIAASASEARAAISNPEISSRSANGARVMPRVNDGTRHAATAVAAAQATGASMVTFDALSASTVCLRSSRTRSRQGCNGDAPVRPASRACIQR